MAASVREVIWEVTWRSAVEKESLLVETKKAEEGEAEEAAAAAAAAVVDGNVSFD